MKNLSHSLIMFNMSLLQFAHNFLVIAVLQVRADLNSLKYCSNTIYTKNSIGLNLRLVAVQKPLKCNSL